jgi:hypothetical protein
MEKELAQVLEVRTCGDLLERAAEVHCLFKPRTACPYPRS